ncbi:hypothetical protein [Candidatus Contubernalis alkaliaceticus]|uniref:hypothetical protein n=1 Tax=Candidatus Contubernalis alkaliaceticus TaxID=338645 RepID=UPI001F4C350A|nr:hypothetical protein [Candidatus Contubernalis alkalaceticus]
MLARTGYLTHLHTLKKNEKKKEKDQPTIKEQQLTYNPDLDKLIPRYEPDLGQALVKISAIAYKHKLSQAEYLKRQKAAGQPMGRICQGRLGVKKMNRSEPHD